jgi:hypothetical protein
MMLNNTFYLKFTKKIIAVNNSKKMVFERVCFESISFCKNSRNIFVNKEILSKHAKKIIKICRKKICFLI